MCKAQLLYVLSQQVNEPNVKCDFISIRYSKLKSDVNIASYNCLIRTHFGGKVQIIFCAWAFDHGW